MPEKPKHHELTKAEERDLDDLAGTSEFFGRLRAAYAEWGSLTERQYDILRERRDRDAWRKDAHRVAGVAVRNRYETRDGSAKCAHREQPYCKAAATVVVGTYGYCAKHAQVAREDLAAWKVEHARETATKGEGIDETSAVTPTLKSRIAEYVGTLDDDLDVPF